ncbi:Aminomethyltransferase [subsurface metagenome]
MLKIKEEGLKRKLVGFEVVDKGIPRSHQEIHNEERKLGFVTSGTFSPSLKKGIGIGYVELPHNKVGTILKVIGKTPIDVKIIKGPFYKRGSHK